MDVLGLWKVLISTNTFPFLVTLNALKTQKYVWLEKKYEFGPFLSRKNLCEIKKSGQRKCDFVFDLCAKLDAYLHT